jgi:16S rRNA (cytosine967-C5)-methyltransferase
MITIGRAMQPSARIQSVIELVQGLAQTAMPADRALRGYFRARRHAGSKDRADISAKFFAVLRRRASFAWRMGSEDARSLVAAALMADGLPAAAVAALFDGSKYGPAPLDAREMRALEHPPQGEPPEWVRGEYPEFLHGELVRAYGGELPAAMAAMQARAPVDLRVNTLKSSREMVEAALAKQGFAVFRTPLSPWGLRLQPGEGLAKLGTSALFEGGAFEFQDEAAQVAALLCGARPGMTVLDLAAGAGGKTLALAAAMENKGEIVAYDIAPKRLHQLEARAERAGASIIRTMMQPPQGRFDIVLVDAPCGGTGTWRRQPELRWRINPARLDELARIQDELLERAAGLVAPGGRLVYATCSVLPRENQDRIEAFLARHPEFAPVAAQAVFSAVGGLSDYFIAAPHTTGTDGFFAAVMALDNSTR